MTDNKPKLGQMLVEAELINELQLKSALVHQQHWRCLFGASLVKLGYLDEEELLGFLADSLNLLRVDLKWRAIPREVLNLVPVDKAREYHVIPVDREVLHGTSYLLVATCDPTHLANLDDLAFLTGCEIRPALASEEEIRAAIDRCYGGRLEPPAPSTPPVPAGSSIDEQDKFHKLLLLMLAKGLISRSEYDLLK
ncbi:hypothetical protein A7E78_04185 [Syntrophotalea acetylenivorans]|uniref:Type II secretion system protein GspE N-terminal domain-containing protein n=1 Tax=Syntrophotalea acetylenivorans TaxID=1842532 RepID=A0A1L3GME6_9BACT|nr:hypothetical protein [Syntrophotalea acetylenivorans]APG27102.1 hypothetical protein A7E78_04185 [Syntrophotalea acetylenivorans]